MTTTQTSPLTTPRLSTTTIDDQDAPLLHEFGALRVYGNPEGSFAVWCGMRAVAFFTRDELAELAETLAKLAHEEEDGAV